MQLDDVVSVTEAAPTRWRHPPRLVLTGGDRRSEAEAEAEAVPAPHSVLVGSEGLQVRVCTAVHGGETEIITFFILP